MIEVKFVDIFEGLMSVFWVLEMHISQVPIFKLFWGGVGGGRGVVVSSHVKKLAGIFYLIRNPAS